MTHLGEFGTKHDADNVEEIVFDYFGETIHGNAELGELDYVDFMDMAGRVDVKDVGPALRMVKDFARICIAPADFEKFWATAKTNRQGVSDIFPVLQAVVEAISDRPTERPSSSSDTPTTTGGSSELSPLLAQRLEGRPDLQLIVLRQQEALAAKAG